MEAQRVWVRCDGVAVVVFKACVVVGIGVVVVVDVGVVVKVGVDEDRR